jgi:outer membrane immunogenic protein
MRRITLGFATVLAMTLPFGVAQAADMAVKAPTPAAVVASDWTGLYFDVDAGWERDSYNWNWISPNLTAAGFGAVGMSSPSGLTLGAHVGYQQQLGWLVLGVEAGASKLANNPTSTSTSTPGVALPCGVATFCRAQMGYVSTVGGKVGVAWQDWMFYGVGGKAFGASVNTAAVTTATNVVFETFQPSNDNGWYVGGGFDVMLVKTRFGDLLGGVEYQHIQLGTIVSTANTVGGPDRNSISAKEDIVWAKLTLKLNPFN